jgi:hypothetical protein
MGYLILAFVLFCVPWRLYVFGPFQLVKWAYMKTLHTPLAMVCIITHAVWVTKITKSVK